MAEQEQDRSESATPHKLREARKRGAVARSADLPGALVLLVMVAFVYALGWSVSRKQLSLSQWVLSAQGRAAWSVESVSDWLAGILLHTLAIWLPLLLMIMAAGVLANLLQVGVSISAVPLKPDFNRLNPVEGFKRLFSLRLVYESGKGIFKLLLIGGVLYMSLRDMLPFWLSLADFDPRQYPRLMLEKLGGLLFKLALVMLVFALIDVVYTRREFAKRMRMSKREVKDEHKQREGDPRIRSRLRELRLEVLKRSQSMRRLPDADVLLTNPTHYAVAVRYRHGDMPAPQVLCKGSGEVAMKLREMARRHAIPVVSNPTLARALFREVSEESYVPEQFYGVLARIFLWLHAQRQMRAELAKAS